jgi:hypothetical protein
LISWRFSGSTHDLSLSIGSGLTFMSLSVQIYICHFFHLMHFSMEQYAVQNWFPPKFNTNTKNAHRWQITRELWSNSHSKVCTYHHGRLCVNDQLKGFWTKCNNHQLNFSV